MEPGELRDGELKLILKERCQPTEGRVPTYRFEMLRHPDGARMGTIDLRMGDTSDVVTYVGHIGYRVHEAFRGHHYALRACRLLFSLAQRHGYQELWITCDPDNTPSRRTLERLGGELISTVAVPKSHPYYRSGSRAKCRFLVRLQAGD